MHKIETKKGLCPSFENERSPWNALTEKRKQDLPDTKGKKKQDYLVYRAVTIQCCKLFRKCEKSMYLEMTG